MSTAYDHDEDIFRGIGIEIELASSEDFLKVRETLTRIGLEEEDRRLRQVCYILHKRGRYVIAHAAELEQFDGIGPGPTDEDIAVRNKIVVLLESWSRGPNGGLGVAVVDEPARLLPCAPMASIRVIPFREKNDWVLYSPYSIGVPKRDVVEAKHLVV